MYVTCVIIMCMCGVPVLFAECYDRTTHVVIAVVVLVFVCDIIVITVLGGDYCWGFIRCFWYCERGTVQRRESSHKNPARNCRQEGCRHVSARGGATVQVKVCEGLGIDCCAMHAHSTELTFSLFLFSFCCFLSLLVTAIL